MTIHAVKREGVPHAKAPRQTALGQQVRSLALGYERLSANSERAAGLRQAADLIDSHMAGTIGSESHAAILELVRELIDRLVKAVEKVEASTPRRSPEPSSAVALQKEGRVRAAATGTRMQVPSGDLPRGEALVLSAVIQHPEGITREHITIVTGYKRSTRDTYISRLADRGYVLANSDGIYRTDDGIRALPDVKPLPKGKKLREHYLKMLPEGESAVLERIMDSWPEWIDREDITNTTGYKRSTRDTYVSRLATRLLVETGSRGVRARKELMR